jgi:hypothetical protein
MKFTEEKSERAFTKLLGQEEMSGFLHNKLDNEILQKATP